jgi:hypothetical protein
MVKSQKIHLQSAACDKKPPTTGPNTGASSMARLKTLIILHRYVSSLKQDHWS